MQDNGHLTQSEADEAKAQSLPIEPFRTQDNSAYLHHVFDEMEKLSEKYSFTVGGKIEIFTYLDPELQKEAENLIAEHNGVDGSAIVLDVKTHGFKAFVSTVGDVKRSPGSTIKPLIAYAPAIEENLLSPATQILDEKTDFNGYAPEN